MQILRRTCLAAASLLLAACAKAGAAPEPALSASAFADSIAVNTHVNYTDGDYAQWRRVIDALKYLDVREVRDQALDPKNQGQENYHSLAQAGLKFTMITWRTDLPQFIADIAAFETKHPGAIAAIEGVNEIVNSPNFGYIGLSGKPAAQAYQRDLNALVKVNPALKHIPVYNFSDDPDEINAADFENFHEYAHQGETPDIVLARGLARVSNPKTPNKPVVCTEFGYFTADRSVGWGGVTEAQQAALILRGLAINAANGVKRTYIYQLLDAYPDKDKVNQENHFGLFDRDFQPKQSAVALRNMLRILRSEKPGEAVHKPAPPAIGNGVKALVLSASKSTYFIIVWADRNSDAIIDLQTKAKQVSVFDPLESDKDIESFKDVSAVQLKLKQGPKILRVRVR